ncbi:MAG: hypothetical protein ACXWK6_12340, partial [Myxococcaceae bacterium]
VRGDAAAGRGVSRGADGTPHLSRVNEGGAELPQPRPGTLAGSARFTGQNVRSSLDTSENVKINAPAMMPT